MGTPHSGQGLDMQEILNFWFQELEPKQWWVKDLSLDLKIKQRFLDVHTAATQGELWHWRQSAEGRLAEILVLDQFSRNIYRDDPRSFAFDGMALVLAQECVELELDRKLPIEQRRFIYMPHMHSESALVHEEAVRLFDQPGLEENLKFEHAHFDIIKRFGRYPHRNQILGRESTPEEIEFLKGPNSSF